MQTIVCLGLLGGRLDHELVNLSIISKYSALNKNLNVIALGGTALMYMVKPNTKTFIKVGKRCILKQSGIVCFGKAEV